MTRLMIFCVLLASCSGRQNNLSTDVGTMAEGDQLAKDEYFEEARKQYFRIKTEFPDSTYQVQADMKIADTYYFEESFPAAATAYEDFIKTYPGRPEIPEALYKWGMSHVRQMPGNAQRDTRSTAKVIDIFTRLSLEYPNSKYTEEAQKWIVKARDQLAQKHFEIGRFYERMGDYESAAKRFGEMADQYSDNPLAEEALARQIRSLIRAKKEDRVEELRQKFQEKYPESKFRSMIKS